MWYNNNNFESFFMLFINTPTHNMLKALDTMCHLHKGARSPKTNNCMLMHQSQQLESLKLVCWSWTIKHMFPRIVVVTTSYAKAMLILEGCGVSIYDHIHNYMGFTKLINHILSTCVFKALSYTSSYVKERIRNYSYQTLMIDTQCTYLHLKTPKLCVWT